MNAVLSPLVSEFATSEQEADYNAWLNAKIEKSLKDTRPNVPHDEVMAHMRALLQSPKPHAAH
jgi:hypothetical protein